MNDNGADEDVLIKTRKQDLQNVQANGNRGLQRIDAMKGVCTRECNGRGKGGLNVVVWELECASKHGLVGEMKCDRVVDVQEETREAGGEVGEEPAREVSKIALNRVRQVLIVMLLRICTK